MDGKNGRILLRVLLDQVGWFELDILTHTIDYVCQLTYLFVDFISQIPNAIIPPPSTVVDAFKIVITEDIDMDITLACKLCSVWKDG